MDSDPATLFGNEGHERVLLLVSGDDLLGEDQPQRDKGSAAAHPRAQEIRFCFSYVL